MAVVGLRRGQAARCVALVTAICANAGVWASWIPPSEAPVGRLAANIGQYIAEHPDDPQGYFVLGRIHSYAFWNKSRTVCFYEADEPRPLPTVSAGGGVPAWARMQVWGWMHGSSVPGGFVQPMLIREDLARHLAESIRNFQKALTLAPQDAKLHIGLAYVLADGAEFAGEVDVMPNWAVATTQPTIAASQPTTASMPSDDALRAMVLSDPVGPPTPGAFDIGQHLDALAVQLFAMRNDRDAKVRERVHALLGRYWVDCAIREYYAAHQLTFDEESKPESLKEVYWGLDSMVSYESARECKELIERLRPDDRRFAEMLAISKAHVEFYDGCRVGSAMTPIIFDPTGEALLADLAAPGHAVRFDLDGSGRAAYWTWVKPSAGLLVWDPKHTGQITSGRQLFGNATWWMLFRDGYEAMDALDDDRDGWLAGEELEGLAVWFDRNSNGASEVGEVDSLEAIGVVALATHSTGSEGDGLVSRHGLAMADGRTLPTYDWVATRCDEPGAEAVDP